MAWKQGVPFMDNDLVEFAMKCPVSLKLKNLKNTFLMDENAIGKKTTYFQKTNVGKQILRNVMKKYIPEEINLRYLNFGSYKTSNLHGYDFQSFGYFGSSKKYWSANLCKVLKNIDDEFVLLALDDFFLAKS